MIDKNERNEAGNHEYSESTDYICGDCGKGFSIRSEFIEKVYCPYCGKLRAAYSCGDARIIRDVHKYD